MHIFFALAIAFSCFLCGCSLAVPPVPEWVDNATNLEWPKPPEQPRIKYLRSLTGREEDKSGKPKPSFVTWLTGEKKISLPFVSPYGIAADGKGRIWVADMGIHGVHVIDLAHKRTDYILSAGNAELISPVGVAVDVDRNRLYLSDSTLRKVFVYSLDGTFLDEWNTNDGLGRPAGLAIDPSGNLYVVDVSENRLAVFSTTGEHLRNITSGSPPDFSFHAPTNVAVNRKGQIYVSDSMNFRIEVFSPDGKSLKTIGQVGDVPGAFGRPKGVAIDHDGHIYVADAIFNNIQVFDNTGQLLIYFGQSGEKPGDLSLPSGIFCDSENRLYVVDTHNSRIQIFQYVDDLLSDDSLRQQ